MLAPRLIDQSTLNGIWGINAVDYKSLTSLLLRLTGIIIIVSSANYVPHTFLSLYLRNASGDVNAETWLLTAIAATFPIVIGLLLIYFPARVANRIVYGEGEAADTSRLERDAQRLEQIAFSVLGLYFVAMAMFDAIDLYARLRLYPLIFSPFSVGVNDRLPWLSRHELRKHRSDLHAVCRRHDPATRRRPRSRQSFPPAAKPADAYGHSAVNTGWP
jgi:hypothetical protein